MPSPDVEAAAPDALLTAIRQATRERHATLDAGLDLRPETLTRERYAEVLRRMAAVVRPLESRLHAVEGMPAWLPDLPQRRKAQRIDDDLAALGDARAVDAAAVPEVRDVAEGFGCGYVLEGSTLGGVVLARTLGPTLGLTPEHGMSFWTAYGPEVGAMWKRFTAALDAWSRTASPAQREAAVQSAARVFDAFIAACVTITREGTPPSSPTGGAPSPRAE